MTLGLHG